MKAIVLDQSGERPIPRLIEVETPVPGPGEVLVQVKAAGLNYRELWWAEYGKPQVPQPVVMGGDAAGLVAGVGAGVTEWTPGDRVVLNSQIACGECRYCRRGQPGFCKKGQTLGWNVDGGFAEYVKVPARNVSRIPAHLEFVGAAALPIAYGTAWNVLFTMGELQPGETVLIPGVGGGVALFALQLAVAVGARAIVTSGSDEKLERARALGAAHGINYRTQDVLTSVLEWTGGEGADLTIDGIGKETLVTGFRATNKAGRVIRYGSLTGGTEIATQYLDKTFKMGGVASYPDWEAAMRFLEQVRLQPVVDREFALAEFAAAFDHLKQQKQFGKVVLTVGE